MKIQTKYNVGDMAYTIDRESLKIRKFEIDNILIFLIKGSIIIKYHASDDSLTDDYIPEENCFASEEDLLKHIQR